MYLAQSIRVFRPETTLGGTAVPPPPVGTAWALRWLSAGRSAARCCIARLLRNLVVGALSWGFVGRYWTSATRQVSPGPGRERVMNSTWVSVGPVQPSLPVGVTATAKDRGASVGGSAGAPGAGVGAP